jgi:hypothetical protein
MADSKDKRRKLLFFCPLFLNQFLPYSLRAKWKDQDSIQLTAGLEIQR